MNVTLKSTAYPPGSTVGAYSADDWPGRPAVPVGAPIIAATTTVAVSANGDVSFTGLVNDRRYFIGGQISGVWNYYTFLASRPVTRPRDGRVISDEGVTFLADRSEVAFVGDAVTVTDDPDNDRAVVTIKGSPVFNVKDYGAKGDGVTDDTAAEQAATAAANAAGGGIVYFPPGTYLGNFTTYPRVQIRGAGRRVTILKSKAASNGDVIQGVNFGTLTGKVKANGDYALGAYECEFSDLTIDGNKANNTAGYGIRIWGRAPLLRNVEITSCFQDGLWTEFTDVDSFADPVQVLEGASVGLSIHDCGGNGWSHRGPHDFVSHNFTAWSNGGWGQKIEQVAGSYNGGVLHFNANCYLNTSGAFYAYGSQFEAHGGQAAAGNTGTGIDFGPTSGSYKILGVVVAGGATGMIVRGTNHLIDVQLANNVGDAMQLNGCGWCNIKIVATGNPNVINVISETGPNHVVGYANVPAASTLKTGSAWNSRTLALIYGNGVGGNSQEQQLPSQTLTAGGWSPVLPNSNGTLMVGGTTTLTYGVSVATNHNNGQFFKLSVTNGTAFTVANPTNAKSGWFLTYDIINNSGGVMGAITWDTLFKLAGAFTNPASTKRRTITFYYDGTNYVEVARAAADI